MPFIDRLDPELRDSFETLGVLFPEDWASQPAHARREIAPAPPVAPEGVEGVVVWSETTVSAAHGGTIRIRVYRPSSSGDPRAGALLIHGGGMWAGTLDSEHPACIELVTETGITGVSVDYRLAPEHPYPAALDDTVAVYEWMIENAAELDIDPDRLAIIGGSAGGGLAVATTLRIRDSGALLPRLLLAMYPMLDDRNEHASTHQEIPFPVWNRCGNIEAWQWYLGGRDADSYAAPARERNLSGLPASFFDVGTCDLFLDEVIAFAERVRAAGVPTELHVYPGLFHAAEFLAPDAALSRRVRAKRHEALLRALAATPPA